MSLLAFASEQRTTNTTPLARYLGPVVIACVALPIAAPVAAEQLTTPVMQQGGQEATDMPAHGQSKTTVRASFGKPETKKGPVGDPPITQWYYSDFVVYFEYDHVIHSVAKPDR